eukprot:7340029-Pyramimonas_sp.AAC.1
MYTPKKKKKDGGRTSTLQLAVGGSGAGGKGAGGKGQAGAADTVSAGAAAEVRTMLLRMIGNTKDQATKK